MSTLEGSCLCGDIRYACDGPLGPLGNCHCTTCQKAHSAAFATTTRVSRERFRWLAGEDKLASFRSSPDKQRLFCPRCGSHLIAVRDGESEVILRVGSLDCDPGGRPVVNIWTEEKAVWHDLEGKLPALPQGMPAKPEA